MPNDSKVTAPIAESITIKKGEPLKNILNADSLREGALAIKAVYEPFSVDGLVKGTMDETWGSLELKARGRQVRTHPQKRPNNVAKCETISIFSADSVVIS